MAGSWTTAGRTPVWSKTPVVGTGSNTQGGNPPALAYEPAAIDENGVYTRSAWLIADPTRFDDAAGKFRITTNFAFFASADPLLYPGEPEAAHHHTFIGNLGLFENGGALAVSNADYASLRNNPKAAASGGPLNATLYWEPTLFLEFGGGIDLPLKPNVVTFYYTNEYAEAPQLFRLLRGLTFIGGVDPTDRLNTARIAEVTAAGVGINTTSNRLNGWNGWQFQDSGGNNIYPAGGSDADINPETGFPRQLVNSDGSDPWAGAANDPNGRLIANINAPKWWDGHNLRSPNGRDHFRYGGRAADGSSEDVGPTGWWKIPHFEVKTEFPNQLAGLVGHAFRSKLYLSSDRHMGANHPRGSTMHFDWMNGWDSVIQHTWHDECNGVTQDGVAGHPLTCNNSTISATQRMLVTEAPPVAGLSNNPVITFHDYSTGPTKDASGPLPAGSRVSGTVSR